MSDYTPQPRVKTLLDDQHFKLTANPVSGHKRPTFHLYYTNNNPRIDIWTNVDNDADKGRITVNLNMTALYQLFEVIEKIALDPTPDVLYKMTNENHPWDKQANRRAKDPVVLSTTAVGRDKEGRVWISVLAANPNRPKICFYFGAHQYHKLSRRGEVLTDAEVSTMAALAFIKQLRDAVSNVSANGPAAYTPKEPQGQNNNQNRSGGGYSASTNTQQDDDLPF